VSRVGEPTLSGKLLDAMGAFKDTGGAVQVGDLQIDASTIEKALEALYAKEIEVVMGLGFLDSIHVSLFKPFLLS
jgi:hypothetical protein